MSSLEQTLNILPQILEFAVAASFSARMAGVAEMFASLNAQLPFTDPSHEAMLYRANELARQKAFLTESVDPIHIYRYPGFQYESTTFYRPFSTVPFVDNLVLAMQRRLSYIDEQCRCTSTTSCDTLRRR
jgi:hypothetical protein